MAVRGCSLLLVLEIATLYSLIQIYVWHWQFTAPWFAWPIFMLLLATHVWRRDTLWSVGLEFHHFLPVLKQGALAAIPFILALILIGTLTGQIGLIPLKARSFTPSLRYILWATFQQYGLQGYFHSRLMQVLSKPFWSSSVNALIFMSFHFPNPILMIFTLLGGFVFSLIYAKNRNIFALGIVHGLMGLLLSNCFPKEILHNMRVGPGYFR